MDEPIFEIIDGNKHYKIWENGKTGGFPNSAKVINRISTMIAYYVNRAIESQDIENPNISSEYKERVKQLFNEVQS
jgi:hypothetical protein